MAPPASAANHDRPSSTSVSLSDVEALLLEPTAYQMSAAHDALNRINLLVNRAANRPGRIGLHERLGKPEANRLPDDALRRVRIILGMLRVKGVLVALGRARDRDGRSPDDSPAPVGIGSIRTLRSSFTTS